MTVLRYTVPPENEGCKLRLFLRMQGVTAGLIKSVKYDGDGFYADDQPIRTNEPVHAGQCIRFALPPEQETSVTPQPVPFPSPMRTILPRCSTSPRALPCTPR